MPDFSLSARVGSLYELQAAFLEPKLKEIGIGWATFQLLSSIHAAGKEASQAEVARRIGVTAATLSEAVASHLKRGLLTQVAVEEDRRLKILKLTDKGKKTLQDVLKVVGESEKVMMKGISDKNLEVAAKTLDRCIANLEKSLG